MKYLYYFIIFIALSLSAFSGWINSSEYGMLNAGNYKIKDYVISEDGKFIYTINDSALIIRWDFTTGDSLSSIKIKSIPDYYNNYFLSSDAKTYIVVGNTLMYDPTDQKDNIFVHSYIYDINNNKLIDSLFTDYRYPPLHQGSMTQSFSIIKYDYNTNKKLMFLINTYNMTNYWRYYEVEHTGIIEFFVRNDTGWISRKHIDGRTLKYYNQDNLFFINYDTYFSSTDMHTGGGFFSSRFINYIYDSKKNSIIPVSYYEKKESSLNGDSERGIIIPVNSTIFSNNCLFMQNGCKLRIFNIDSAKFTKIIFYNEYENKNNFSLKLPLDSVYYIITSGHNINLHNFENHRRNLLFSIDSASDFANVKKSTANNYLFSSDKAGRLYRISYDELFKLKANFITQDTVYWLGDSVKFIDLSLGKADKYYWDFGDGTTSTEKHPIHIYSDTGHFDVKLIIKKGNKKDSLIKRNILYIIPNTKVTFSHKIIKEGDSATLVLWNTTKGLSDSLHWEILNNTLQWELLNRENPGQDTVKFICHFGGKYHIKLTFFRATRSFPTEKVIYVNIPEVPIYDNNFIYEFTDTTHWNFIAYKGFDDNKNNLIYHIKNDSVSYYGLINSKKGKWSVKTNSIDNYIFRRKENIYTFANQKVIYNFNRNNDTFDSVNAGQYFKKNKFTCNDSNLVIIEANRKNFYHSYTILTLDNKYYKYGTVMTARTERKLYDITVRRTDTIIDKIITVSEYTIYDIYDRPVGLDRMTLVNRHKYSYVDFKDILRLNENILIIMFQNGFYVYYTNEKKSQRIDYPDYVFNDIKKINKNIFIIAGEYKGHPAYWLFDEYGFKIRERIYTERYGAFYYVYKSDDGNLLFSGFRYTGYSDKYPYFLKIKRPFSIIAEQMINISSFYDHYCYPNPATESTVLKILIKKETDAQISIYNTLGELIHAYDKVHLNRGMNEFEINLDNKAIGNYFYMINIGSETAAGMIVHLR